MKKSSVTISLEDEKLSAVKLYMQKKNINLEDEMTLQLEKLYAKYVPVNVQEYINERNPEDTPTPLKRPPKHDGNG